MTENEIRINETTMWREWITARGLEPITLQDIDDRLAELKQRMKVEPEVKVQANGLLQYIPDKPMELPDGGAVQNKYGITASGVRILNELREILIKAGY